MNMKEDSNGASEKIKMLKDLRQVRNLRSDPVPDDVINDILEVARWSGSGNNRQPWEFVVLRDRATLEAFSGIAPYIYLPSAAFGLVIAMSGQMPDIESYDEGRLTERIMLAAEAHGIGSAIGWFRGDDSEKAKKLLGIPEDRRVRTTISFGYPDEEARNTRPKQQQARKPLVELVHWDKY